MKDYEKTFEKELSLEDESETEDFPFSASSLTLKKTRSNLLILPINEWLRGKIDWDKSQVKHLLADNPREWTTMVADEERSSKQYYTQDSIKLKNTVTILRPNLRACFEKPFSAILKTSRSMMKVSIPTIMKVGKT